MRLPIAKIDRIRAITFDGICVRGNGRIKVLGSHVLVPLGLELFSLGLLGLVFHRRA